jgi:hypothetical protein
MLELAHGGLTTLAGVGQLERVVRPQLEDDDG